MGITITRESMARTRVDATLGFLQGAGVRYELCERGPLRGASGESRPAGLSQDQIAKTIVLCGGDGYVIVAVPVSRRLDIGKLRAELGATHELRLAQESEIALDFPTLELGAAPPFGPTVPAADVIDATLAEQAKILCAAGDDAHSVLVDPYEIVRITGARVADISDEARLG